MAWKPFKLRASLVYKDGQAVNFVIDGEGTHPWLLSAIYDRPIFSVHTAL